MINIKSFAKLNKITIIPEETSDSEVVTPTEPEPVPTTEEVVEPSPEPISEQPTDEAN